MPRVKADGKECEVESGKRLVNALVEDLGIDQLHACGGQSKCTTCKVEFLSGEPHKMTAAEKETLQERGVEDVRLSCQILCEEDMEVSIVSRLEGSGRADQGTKPAATMEPEPEWVTK